MGQAKNEAVEMEERGWSNSDGKFVCSTCVEDEYLKTVIRESATQTRCNYCGTTSREPIAAPLDVLMLPIASAVFYHYSDPTNAGVPWDGGVALINSVGTDDVLEALPLECHCLLFNDVMRAFAIDAWVEAAGGHWLSSQPHEVLRYGWHRFASLVRHETRFNFHLMPTDSDDGEPEIAPADFLPALGRQMESAGLVQTLSTGSKLFRVRVRQPNATWQPGMEQLGPPPQEHATAGRMNPAGIPYLYTALGQATAIAETATVPPVEIVVATFEATKALTIINLTALPPIPSVFDEAQRARRESLLFLHAFVQEISRPIAKDGAEHVNYVPTQVVCEYLAQIFVPTGLVDRIDGLLYPSSVQPGGKNLVLFPNQRIGRPKFDSVSFLGFEIKRLSNWPTVTAALLAQP
jgi:RES domain-containing protein/ribosomal protein S27E